MHNKIGFNNFKAFGSQIQYFTKKPITLIYGPNSVGKSSLLHSQIYFEYLRKTNPQLDLFETYFAGDKLDLGGFETFAHKHDMESPISFELDISDKVDIHRLLSLNGFEMQKIKVYNFKDLDFSIKNLEEFLNLKLEYKITMKDIISLIQKENRVQKSKKILEQYPQNGHIHAMHNDNLKALEASKKIVLIPLSFTVYKQNKDRLNKEDLLEQEKLKFDFDEYQDRALKLLDKCIQKTKESNDIFTQYIILSGEIKPKSIKAFFDYLNYLYSINNVKIKISLEANNNKVSTSFEYFIDNEQLFNTKNNIVNKNHPLIGYLEQIEASKKIIIEDFDDLLDKDDKKTIEESIKFQQSEQYYDSIFSLKMGRISLFHYSVVGNEITPFFEGLQTNFPVISTFERLAYEFINNQNIEQNIQYYGPLRFYPERFDLSIKNKKGKKQKQMDKANLINFNNMESIFNKKPFIYFKFAFWKTIFTSQAFFDIFNRFLPEKSKLSTQGESSSSLKIWDTLILSKEMQDKLNTWLSNEKKLKSIYQIKVHEEDNYKYLVFFDIQKKTEVTPRDMGLGISQMIPILISTMGSTHTRLYLEQPELHLHPAVQMELMDEFIRSHNENNNEFMMESHSEHMLLRVMKRLRQTANGTLEDESLRLTPDDVCLLYVDNDGEKTYIQELRLSQTGKLLDHWPNGFFEEGYKERFM